MKFGLMEFTTVEKNSKETTWTEVYTYMEEKEMQAE